MEELLLFIEELGFKRENIWTFGGACYFCKYAEATIYAYRYGICNNARYRFFDIYEANELKMNKLITTNNSEELYKKVREYFQENWYNARNYRSK